MVSYVNSGTVFGIESYIICVETDTSNGLPTFDMVGMLNSEVREAKERVKVSLKNNGFSIPPLRITVNLSPADIRKDGTKFDLPIAISLLISLGEIEQKSTEETVFLGELGLDGELKFVKGVLPIVIEAKKQGFKRIIVPKENSFEAAAIEGIEVFGLSSLLEVVRFLSLEENERINDYPPVKIDIDELFKSHQYDYDVDFADITGQKELKRACVIAAAGFHHVLMIGPPGCGKTMAAKRMPTILPPLSYEESLEVSKIYSVSGYIKKFGSLMVKRPYNSPHHTITENALSGGGNVPKPGVISLSHRGVLFLDEAVHFDKRALEILRQPLEDRKIVISRSAGTFEYPSDFMLIAAVNPCPCGFYPDRNRCRCSENQIKNYIGKLSGPIMDRIDICVYSEAIEYDNLKNAGNNEEDSASLRKKIIIARNIQEERFKGNKIRFNSEMTIREIEKYCKLEPADEVFLEKAFRNMRLSARAYHKILRVARTIADLDGKERITKRHLAEALNYRMGNEYIQ
ncbi:MAG: YifB family Mg chelatase-like AAA ATPase [Lachnospiraceae bacterium]|nr:YifB family Mg chelatase-like AAA ATPase [Lachnospiraceae bacterium]